jgi:Mce-associated membrane protein
MTPSDQPENPEGPDVPESLETVVDAESAAIEVGEVGEVDEVDATELAAESPQGPQTPPSLPGSAQRALAWCRQRWAAVLTVAALLVSAVTAGSVYWWLYRPDRLTDTASQEQVLSAAREATEALLSYSPEEVDTDVAAAKALLTGDFLQKYTEFADTVVVPAAKGRGVKTEANVARAAMSQMRPGDARVLIFVNQVTTSKERPTPALATSSVMVTLVRSDGRWLVSEFNPI